jgi:hypothetical protein
MPLIPVKSVKGDEIRARVVGIWRTDSGLLVQIMPGASGGIAAGMVVKLALTSGSENARATIARAGNHLAEFFTNVAIDLVPYEVLVSEAAPVKSR